MKKELQKEIDQGTLGDYLRQARTDLDLDISDIAAITRISLRVLHAMETDDHASLPPAGFSRGFYSIYAKHLGLPVTEILHRFDSEVIKKTPKKQRIKTGRQGKDTETFAAKPSRTLRTVVGVSLVLIVVIAALASLYFSWNPATFISEKIQNLQESTKSENGIPETAIHPGTAEEDTHILGPRYVVTVEFFEDTVIAVSVDNARLEEDVYTKGSIRNWYSKSSIFLKFKDDSQLAIKINGEPLQLPPPSNGEILISLPARSIE